MKVTEFCGSAPSSASHSSSPGSPSTSRLESHQTIVLNPPRWRTSSSWRRCRGVFLVAILPVVGFRENERDLVALALGLVVPIATIGVISELPLPLSLIPDLAFVPFLRMLWKGAQGVVTAN